jgi:hypothetical protein
LANSTTIQWFKCPVSIKTAIVYSLHKCTYTEYSDDTYGHNASGGYPEARFSFTILHHATHWQLEPLAPLLCSLFCMPLLQSDCHQFHYHILDTTTERFSSKQSKTGTVSSLVTYSASYCILWESQKPERLLQCALFPAKIVIKIFSPCTSLN